MAATTHTSSDYARWRQMSRNSPIRSRHALESAAGGCAAMALAESWASLDEIATGQAARPYVPTYSFRGEHIDERHRAIAEAPMGRFNLPFLIDVGIDGYLLKADALKLYELAYFSPGNVLELGTHKGLSTAIMASALEARGNGLLETVDIDAAANQLARQNVMVRPGGQRVRFTLEDATARMDGLIASGTKFGTLFIDHWHGYDATYEAATRAAALLVKGGFVFFHDYLDAGNADPEHVYGVFPAVLDSLYQDDRFEFYGNFGACGLYRLTA